MPQKPVLGEEHHLVPHTRTGMALTAPRCTQAVSSRPDVIPPGYLSELEKLQDQIPPFPDEDAYALIGAEMGAPARTLFSELSASPVAAASLGQVRQLPHSFLTALSLPLRDSGSASRSTDVPRSAPYIASMLLSKQRGFIQQSPPLSGG